MSKFRSVNSKLKQFIKPLRLNKHLTILYFFAFIVGLGLSVYLQNTVTNTSNEAAVIPNWRCDRQQYYGSCQDLQDAYGNSESVVKASTIMPTCNDPDGPTVNVFTNCICESNCPTTVPPPPTNTPRPPTNTPRPPTNTPTPVGVTCKGTVPSNASSWGNDEDDNVPPDTRWNFAYVDHNFIKCEFYCKQGYSWNGSRCAGGVGGGPTATTGPSASPTTRPTITSRPSATPTSMPGTKGCGIQCDSTSECQSGFSCENPNTGHNVCWNAGICGGPALKSRVEGIVRGCNNEPLQGVPVWAWGNTDYTDQNGKFQLNKGINRNSEGDITLNETTIKAGNDATFNTTTGLGYFDNGTGRQYDALQLRSGNSCGLVNCLFSNRVGDGLNISDSHKLMAGGPSRTAYRLGRRSTNPNQGLTDELFEYNFVFTDYYAKSFNFKKIGCPTVPPPTLTPPPLLSCNASCSTDAQCRNTNSSWYCATQFNYQGWFNDSAYILTIQYMSGGQTLTQSGETTGINMYLSPSGTIEQHIVKAGKVFYRTKPANSGWTTFTDVSSYVNSVGCTPGTVCLPIVGFNSYRTGSGTIEQHLIRSNSTQNKIMTRNNSNGWSTWVDVTGNLSSVGTGRITSFTSYMHRDGYKVQDMVRNGEVWQRTDQNGWSSWSNASSLYMGCSGTTQYKCGVGKILALERSRQADGSDIYHLFREGNKAYSLKGLLNGERCRLKTKSWSTSCQ